MSDVLAAACALLTTTNHEDAPMDKDLLTALGLEPSDDDAKTKQAVLDAVAALKATQSQAPDTNNKSPDASAPNADQAAQQQAAASDQTALQQQVVALNQQLSALQAASNKNAVHQAIDTALQAGKITTAQAKWAKTQVHWDVAACSTWLDTQLPIAALSGTQQVATMTDERGLTAAELAVCQATGVDPKDFAATKQQGV